VDTACAKLRGPSADGRFQSVIDFDRYDRVRALRATEDALWVLDQRLLPHTQTELHCTTSTQVVEAIRTLAVRGAPAIGIAGAYGAWLAARESSGSDWRAQIEAALLALRSARPTAVNLAWAIDQQATLLSAADDRASAIASLQARAIRIEQEDLAANRHMGELGANLIDAGSSVLTHCNTGSLATAGFGTALGVIRAGVALGRIAHVYAAETRPWLQGARLTLWELLSDGIDARLIADGAGAALLQSGKAQWVITGADRICANGDSANKIGTLAHACAARQFGARMMIVAPWSTVDMATAHGDQIHIEERDPNELLEYAGQRVAAAGGKAWNPVFDVTPGSLIDAIVTERGVARPPFTQSLAAMAQRA
jgi:methylthioribose-1-phosphate isomerase